MDYGNEDKFHTHTGTHMTGTHINVNEHFINKYMIICIKVENLFEHLLTFGPRFELVFFRILHFLQQDLYKFVVNRLKDVG